VGSSQGDAGNGRYQFPETAVVENDISLAKESMLPVARGMRLR
jgi:hypothetical protein